MDPTEPEPVHTTEEEEPRPSTEPPGEEEEEEEEGRENRESQEESAPHQLDLSVLDVCPEPYRINSAPEIRLLALAENFQRQFSHLYPDRRPLLLFPVNECGVQKFVSTTLRATTPDHPKLLTWEGCAEFVAGFLSLEPLASPVDLPCKLSSPTSVVKTQKATCFEYATLLCSLLLGTNYDAYCVSGYAAKEMCLLDQSLQDCPLPDPPAQSVHSVISEQPQQRRYRGKPKKEFKSQALTQEEQKEEKVAAEAASLPKQEPEQSEQLPVDPLQGLRVHCWVLVLSGSRSVQENFFIDPLTGIRYKTDAPDFLGIESVWNNFNYYVNKQDCRTGCRDMVYDLDDITLWEPLLFGAMSKKQLNLEASNQKLFMAKDEELQEEQEAKLVLEMPTSWVSYISITQKDMETGWPGGHKLTRYRRAELERFALCLRPDGLITRWVSYKDLDCTEAVMVKEWYQNRSDNLEEREVNKVDNMTTERFKFGRGFHLSYHRYESLSPGGVHEMKFSRPRLDSLLQRLLSPGEMTETFEGRSDLLYYRRVVFDGHVQFSDENSDPTSHLLEVVERFHRDASKPANEDVAERVFLLKRRRINVEYHLGHEKLCQSRRRFIKPREERDEGPQDIVSSLMLHDNGTPPRTLTQCRMLEALMEEEEKSIKEIQESLNEVADILTCRREEERDLQLVFPPWSTKGLARSRVEKRRMELQAAEEQRLVQEKKKDILAPLLIRHNITDNFAASAKMLHQECLSEFSQKLEEEAKLIQERIQKATLELQGKQEWYHQNQLTLTDQQIEDYQTYCFKKKMEIRVAQKRFKMHEEAAFLKRQALDQSLKQDPRLAPHLPC